MDKFDQAIISHLSDNARQSIAAIGKAIGLSRTAVNDRIQKLEQAGIIRRYTVELGEAAQPASVCAYFELTFRPFEPARVKQAIAPIREIRQAHALSGSTDLMLYVEAPSMDRLNQVRQQLAELENLEKLVTATALEQLI
ncbi:Lrp/AsnC family transcriptional regulator [Marinobacterium arenosum]|uniref:Lrp/AsnC family transcriptional regulator n=1 Tax=Marinobacterium arenosum TaxID=2862496 RepID=UPI001C958ECC|nr:Lrp/AsnC family transcriptional regulator [Marinobacterium arenosum]MBY4678955.1 Lrp/AsnC family transcriptional regulator [Marinobacterium arenosum]